MNVLDTAKKRYSVRTYEDKPVEKEKLDKILASAHVAPTAANLQPVKLLVVQDKKRLDCIAKAGNIYIMLHWQLLFAQTMKKRGLDLLITNRQQILMLLF